MLNCYSNGHSKTGVLEGENQGKAFEACSNCDGILKGRVKKIITGTSSKNVKN